MLEPERHGMVGTGMVPKASRKARPCLVRGAARHTGTCLAQAGLQELMHWSGAGSHKVHW